MELTCMLKALGEPMRLKIFQAILEKFLGGEICELFE